MIHYSIADFESSDEFRHVLWTGEHSQLVMMTLASGEDIGMERHTVDQMLVFVSGVGTADVDGEQHHVVAGDVVVVPAGIDHNFINDGPNPLVLYTIYAPAEHGEHEVQAHKE